MLIVGLTGSIGMGKSTAARRFADHGIPVFDADAEVHRLYQGPAAARIEAAFPGTTDATGVDRKRLAAAVLDDPQALARLETIVHPLVREAECAFLRRQAAAGADMVVLEIPLLFETGAETRVDATVVVTAPADIQRARVLARPGMTPAKLDAMLAKQLSDAEKRARADFVVDTSGPVEETGRTIDGIIESLKNWPAVAWARRRGGCR